MTVKVIGCGAAGNKATITAIEKEVLLKEQCLLLNTTIKDIPNEYADIYMNVGQNFDGCGKERSLAKNIVFKALQDASLSVDAFCKEASMIVLVTSTSGGSGSGISTLLAKYIRDVLGISVHIIAFTGFEADGRELQNTIEFFQDIEETFVVETISNKKFLTGNNKIKAENSANQEFCNRIVALQGDLLRNSVQNIDGTDLFKLVTTPGYMDIITVGFGTTKIKNVQVFEGQVIAALDESKSLETGIGCHRLGVIINCKEESLDYIDTNMTFVRERYGVPYESFLHIQHEQSMPEFVVLIIGGMKLPLEEIQEAYERYKKMSSAVNKEKDSFFSTIASLRGEAQDSMFDMPVNTIMQDRGSFFKNLEADEENKSKLNNY